MSEIPQLLEETSQVQTYIYCFYDNEKFTHIMNNSELIAWKLRQQLLLNYNFIYYFQ